MVIIVIGLTTTRLTEVIRVSRVVVLGQGYPLVVTEPFHLRVIGVDRAVTVTPHMAVVGDVGVTAPPCRGPLVHPPHTNQ